MKSFLRSLVSGALLMGLAACATTSSPPLSAAESARLHAARFVLLGEVHDNATQHRERAALLSALLADGRPTRVVFEQMDRGGDGALAAAPRDAEALASAGALDRKAWQWPLHRPLLQAAAEGGAVVQGGNLPQAEVRAIVRGGLAAVPADLQGPLSDPAWPARAQATLEREIDEGHCHALPQKLWVPMVLAQRARDAAMAQTLLGTGTTPRVVLIAGNGHVRKDWGVAYYLRQAGVADRDIVTVGYLEEQEGAGESSAAAAASEPPFDIVRRTPRAARPDPCAAFEPPRVG